MPSILRLTSIYFRIFTISEKMVISDKVLEKIEIRQILECFESLQFCVVMC